MTWLSRLFGSKPESQSRSPVPPPMDLDFLVLDVETACSRVSSICQLGIVGFRDGRECFEFESLLDPQDEFHEMNVSIHGIDKHHVRGQPHFGTLHETLNQYMNGRLTVSHSSFDRGAISAACVKHGKPNIDTLWVDSVQVARRAWPDLGSHKLNLLARHLDLPHKHHDALSDARAAGLVVVRAMEMTGLSIHELAQPVARETRAPASLKRSPHRDVSGSMQGECVAMSGDFILAKSALADRIAAAGGAVSPSVTRKTTILALGTQDLTTFAGHEKSAKHRKAEDAISMGQAIRILSERELMALLA